jgi:hypothetical protein
MSFRLILPAAGLNIISEKFEQAEPLNMATTHLMMVTNCDMVISCGTRNLVLSSWGKLISL